jgi:hypothetical protein
VQFVQNRGDSLTEYAYVSRRCWRRDEKSQAHEPTASVQQLWATSTLSTQVLRDTSHRHNFLCLVTWHHDFIAKLRQVLYCSLTPIQKAQSFEVDCRVHTDSSVATVDAVTLSPLESIVSW